MPFVRFAAVLALAFASAAASASGLDRLRTFIQSTQSARSQFAQEVLDSRQQRSAQAASGSFEFQRPGRFRWTYDKPYEQIIVGDGARLWVYDKELKQVTVRKLDQALGSTPAALLAGSNEIESSFTLSDSGSAHGLEWVEAVPRDAEGSFQQVRMGFDQGSNLRAMELRDSFGQVTRLKFSGLQRNPRFDPEHFRFTPPPGVDVIGE